MKEQVAFWQMLLKEWIMIKRAIFSALALGMMLMLTSPAQALNAKEGFLYSAIGCTSLFKKLDQPERADQMVNFIHEFSAQEDITEIQPGYMDRFIKLIEKKWEKENDVARKNCDGIFEAAKSAPKPEIYNPIAQSVIAYMQDLDETKKRNQEKGVIE